MRLNLIKKIPMALSEFGSGSKTTKKKKSEAGLLLA